jgi:Zn-dependent protease with chaperone function
VTVAGSTSPPQSPTPGAPRLALHAFPSPTTTRFVVILAAMLASGLFVGDWVHGLLRGEQYVQVIESCLVQAGYTPSADSARAQLAGHDTASSCYANEQYVRAAFSLGSAILVMLAGVGVLFLAPPVIERRRRLIPIVPKLPEAESRVIELARRAGLRHPPTAMLGNGTQLDAFSYGSPRRHRIALPRAVAVRWRNRAVFDPLVSHELAHLCNRDVGLSWLTRGVMYAIIPTLALPLVVGAATAEFSIFPDYAWRATILAVTVWMISIALLRSREHDADLRAAALLREPDAMIALVGRAHAPSGVWWRRLKANHPTPAARVGVLTHPQYAAAVKFLDGLAPAFLAASAIPLVEAVVTALSTANPFGPYQSLVATGTGGVLLGGTVGIGIWRAVAVDRAVSARPSPWVPAIGVAVGLVLGQVASLANTTTGLRGGLDQPGWLIIQAIAGLAATALVYSLAEVWADAASRLRSPRWAWIPGVVVASLVYFAALYLSQQLQLSLDAGSWAFTRRILAGELDSWPVTMAVIAAGLMTGIAVVIARPGALAPAWLFDESTPVRSPWPTAGGTIIRPLLIGLACGVCAIVPYAVYRNSTPIQLNVNSVIALLEVTTWCGAAAGAAAALALILCVPGRGLAVAALAGPVAIGTYMIGFVVINAIDTGPTSIPILASILTDILGLSFLLVAGIAPLALIPRVFNCGVGWSVIVAATITLVACTGAVAVTAAADQVTEDDLILGDLAPTASDGVAAREYLTGTGKEVTDGVLHAYTTFEEIAPQLLTGDPAILSQRIRSEIVEPLTVLKTNAQIEQSRSELVAAVHADAIALIDAYITTFGRLADGLVAGDVGMVALSMAEFDQSSALFDRWTTGMDILRAAAR